jgi:ankyrin repeat protein
MDHCQHCNKGFATRSSLKRHIHAKHPNELGGSKKGSMVHSCSHCHQSFTRSESLKRHILNKHGRGPSLCSFCQKPFRADFMSQHGPRCARKYWEKVQKHASLGVGNDTAQFKTTPNIIQLGLQDSQGRNASRLSSNGSPTSGDEHHNIRIVHEFNFDARLTGVALTSMLRFFELTDDIDAYKQALVAAFRLNIIFDGQNIRPLQESGRFSDLAELALMIDEVNRDHASINTMESNGMTILHLACGMGLGELLEPLFWRGASFDIFDETGLTPLEEAVGYGDLDTVLFALALGADPNSGNPLTVASSAGRRDITTVLIEYGADFNESLVSAICGLDLNAVRFILSLDLNPDLYSFDVVESIIDIISYRCCQDADPCVHEQIALAVLEYGVKIRPEEDFWFISHWAFSKASVQLLRATLKQVTSPNVLNAKDSDSGWTALHFAAEESDKKSTHRKMMMVSLLLEAGADIDARTRSGFTALDLAVEYGNEVLVELLLDAGASIKTPPNCKQSALTLAACRNNGRIARLLIAAGADVDWQDEDGGSALRLAVIRDNVEIVRMLLDAKADTSLRDEAGDTALTFAAIGGHGSMVKLLLDAGADVDVRTASGETALSLAVKFVKNESVRLLLAAGAKFDTWTLEEPFRTFAETVLDGSGFRTREK